MRSLDRLEQLLLVVGLFLIAIYVLARLHGGILSRAELRRFHDSRTQQSAQAEALSPLDRQFKFDFSLWSKQRIAAYEESLTARFAPALAVLRISKVNLEVPVLEGTDDLTLNRAVGHIPGTVFPGEEGNVGIAGHRDGFFRVLKDVGPGDSIELQTRSRTDAYRVDRIVLVPPDDVSVLQPRMNRSLTLVTCYPFYFIGSAPQRYIVAASLVNSEPIGSEDSGAIASTRSHERSESIKPDRSKPGQINSRNAK